MSEYADDELEELKRRRLLEMEGQAAAARREEETRREIEARKQALLRVILTPEARGRLTNIKMIRPEIADAVEIQLIQLYQAGKIKKQISDYQLKEMLAGLQRRRDIRITRR